MFKRKKINQSYDYFSATKNSDIETNERFKEKLDFLALSRIRRESVGFLRKIYENNRQHILDNFYARLLEIPEFNQVINTHSTVERLKGLFDTHFISLFDDELDLDYVFKRRKIAYVHARIGVLPNWMISAYTLINQLIIPLIVKELSRDEEKMLDVLLSYDSLVTIDQQIILETYIEIQAGSVVNGLGEIITYNTQLDTIKELIEFQEIQQQEIVAADQLMHELDESIEEIATSVGDISEQTKHAFKKLNQDLESLQQVSSILQTTDEGHKSMQEDIRRLVERVNSVAKLMELIKKIADQTNLLALNASIEAARAGEAGKGFAVVAEEVRKLADDTSTSVKSIHTDIQELLHITHNISSLTTQFSQDLHQGVTDTLYISQTLAELNKNLQQQGARFEEIATTAKVQAQSATTISERNHTITESMQKSKVIVFDMGSAIYKLSTMIDGYRSTTISKNFIISQEDIIELAITDHLLWRWKIYNLLLGFETMTEQDVGSPKESRLGEWYYGTGKKLLGDERVYTELEQPFIHVHDIAKKAVREYNVGNKTGAEKYLKEITDESYVVIEKLKELKEILLSEKKQYIH
ncbi:MULTISPECIES: methyl-accepting chemotaxis protein [Lysinibacillus]|uniref:methyl-accepting chemotaxis protein n=1 Tax=Lysinibacillus TaxID=400634 RepID=UPI001C8C0ED1|nr:MULTISPECIES: protoglobin domain-containing protein [Lysinibacillus]MBX8946256.1 chemotaxis protein [Lysinibacillus sp. K60]WDU78919.1 methyl-accepting chemotaxis protein [Lysinibacillus sp. G01H]